MKYNDSLLHKWLLSTCISTALLASMAAAAHAQPEPATPPTTAREHFAAGRDAYAIGDYEEAIRRFTAAHDQEPRPAFLYNLAQAHGRLGHVEEEARFLGRFVNEARSEDPALLESARARLRALHARLARTSITVSGAPDGAVVHLDGEPTARAPVTRPLLVEPGAHEVVLVLHGYEPLRASVSVQAGQSVNVEVAMSEVDQNVPGEATPVESEPAPRASIALWSVGGAMLVAGAVTGGVGLSRSRGAIEGTARAGRARRLGRSADVLMGAGVATATVGLVVYLLRGPRDEREEADAASFHVAPWAATTEFGAVVGAQF